ncbi:hypothetical protein BV22DRAFT_1132739 [Leucogyrophana mollusca]|uniref:Uncharacterized protein n=1 Tax=Leucogyrophana mollusca TaxID=85980 RepID=A0ACB8B7L5_9AGAM|nr:hypothetical protein BV22DRAFT_1132739 [Leucogyrophana mollusca]
MSTVKLITQIRYTQNKKKTVEDSQIKHDVEKLIDGTAPQLEQAILQAEEMNKLARNAIIGNPRAIKQEEVKKLLKSFLQHGLNRFEYLNAIPLCIPPGFVKVNTYMTLNEFLKQDSHFSNMSLLEVEFREGAGKICAAGGAHQLQALLKYLDQVKALLVSTEQQIRHEDGIGMEAERLTAIRNQLARTLAYKGQWLIVLYDLRQEKPLFVYRDL